MKKSLLLIPLSLLAISALVGCNKKQTSEDDTESISLPDPSGNTDGGTTHTPVTVDETPDEPEVNNSGSFSLKLGDDKVSAVNGVYTITTAGTYTAKGVLEDGQIIVDAGDEDEVVIELKGASISCSTDSPIKALNADKLEISAKKDTANEVIDNRSAKTVENDNLGEGAINAKCDLKLKGTGTLVVKGNYNNGVHTTKDLDIQKQTLYVVAVNNALKGKNSIEMISGTVTAISKKGNGLKTDNTDLSSKGNQRGSVTISGGTLIVDSAFDAIDAAYNVLINEENEDSLETSVSIKTGAYSTFSANYVSTESAKGIKADNDITIAAGTVALDTSDDGIHANYGDVIASGGLGAGTINVTGGLVGIKAGDDGIHADHTLKVTGGIIDISRAKEGLEATHIKIEGGSTSVYGTDDGVNASQKINDTENPSVEISGGFLDVAMSSGDTDGIDSNGTFTMTGGFVVSRGGFGRADRMSTGLDCDMTAKMSGGTFIAFNGVEKKPTTSTDICYAYYGSSSGGGGPHWTNYSQTNKFGIGVYTLAGDDMTKTFENVFEYNTFLVYSSEIVSGKTYTLSLGETTVLSWTQQGRNTEIR